MACGCAKHRTHKSDPPDRTTLPDEQCVFCAEKHLSYAHELSVEFGYVPKNRQRIIGQLSAAEWHIWKTNEVIAEKIRDIRHAVQARNKVIDWGDILAEMDAIATKESENE